MNQKNQWLWDWLKIHCPKIPLNEATNLVETFERTERDRHNLARCVGVLTETKLGISHNGELPDISKDRPAVQWAMKHAQYIHAGWVCGPVSDGMKVLIEEIEKEQIK